jgi:nicotinate dehydrogenase subunit B
MQDAYGVRRKIALLLGLPENRVRVQYWEGASSFGNSPCRYDTPEAAAAISQLAHAPVRLQFMRWDEHGWDNYGPAILADLSGSVDGSGNITGLEYTAFGLPSLSTQTDVTMQNAGIPLKPPGAGAADTINSGTQYTIPNRRVVGKSLPLWNTGFGQWRDALTAVADLAGWQPRPAASRISRETVVRGRGIALGGFAGSQAGVVAEIELNRRTGKIRATHLYVAQVAGFALYLPGIENQMEGNLVMGASRALVEEVAFDRRRSLALDWASYPILRFADAPRVSTRIVQRPDLASTGSGEPPSVPVPAAIANAFFDATGVRIRTAPMTPGRVRAVLAAAAVA